MSVLRTAVAQACATVAAMVIASSAFAVETSRVAEAAPPGALTCGGCHGVRQIEGAPPRITGRPAAEIVAALADFRSGERQATLMGRIAKGFSPDEDRAIAVWLARQR